MTADRRVVVDASALVAWILRERGAEVVGRLLPFAVVPAPNLVETLYRVPERGHRMPARDLERHVRDMGVAVEPFGEQDVTRAAELIIASRAAATASLSLGDGLCLAIAERLGLPVTGADRLWASLDLDVPFLPFRS